MASFTRRNTLAILGLSTVPIGAEAAVKEAGSSGVAHRISREKMVASIRAFADGIERGEFGIRSLECNSKMGVDDVALNTLTIEFLNKGQKSEG